MKGVNIDDPIMREFVDNLDRVNTLAESSPGFIWRLKDDNNDATSFNPYNDEQVIINVSVWDSVENLENFVFKTFHTDFLKRRKEWFRRYGEAHTALWWIPEGQYPSVQEAVDKLKELQDKGASPEVFDFRKTYPKP